MTDATLDAASMRVLATWCERRQAGAEDIEVAEACLDVTAAWPRSIRVQALAKWVRRGVGQADQDVGFSATGRRVRVDSPRAVIRVPAGAPVPIQVTATTRRRGCWDTPWPIAQRLGEQALACGMPHSAHDASCGLGTLLLALAERGVRQLSGSDTDPAAVTIARRLLPEAHISLQCGLEPGPQAELVIGNPPFVSPERQGQTRASLRRRFPWLEGRFDLCVPMLWQATDRVLPGGVLAQIFPSAVLNERYGRPLRQRWLASDRVVSVTPVRDFKGVAIPLTMVVIRRGEGPAQLPGGAHATSLMRLARVPMDGRLTDDVLALASKIRACSVPMSELARVDTGVVAHGGGMNKSARLHDCPGEGRVPFADARDAFQGRRQWLDYHGQDLHRPKDLDLFAPPKLVVQRIRGRGPVRVYVDTSDLVLGHTCTVIKPLRHAPPPERLKELLTSDLIAGWLTIFCGEGLDLYPADVAAVPVPRRWVEGHGGSLCDAWGLSASEASLLRALGIQKS